MSSEQSFQPAAAAPFATSGGGGELAATSMPPPGSRLNQYMQSNRKLSSDPQQNGLLSSGDQSAAFPPEFVPASQYNTQNYAAGGSNSWLPGGYPGGGGRMPPSNQHQQQQQHPLFLPPTSSFAQMGLSQQQAMPHSVSTPVLQSGEGPFPGFSPVSRGNYGPPRDTPTPPNLAPRRRLLTKSPVPDLPVPNGSGNVLLESIGGTTYFYAPSEEHGQSGKEQCQQPSPFASPAFYSYAGPSSHLAHFRPKGPSIASFFAPTDLKMELVEKQLAAWAQVDPEQYPDLPYDVDAYHQLSPLEPPASRPGFFPNFLSTTYKAVGSRDGIVYSLRRLHNCRLVNSKCLAIFERWKKLVHSNVVQVRELCTTKAFKDNSLVFVYDYHAGAETLRYRHFSGFSGSARAFEEAEGQRGRIAGSQGNPLAGSKVAGGVSEALIWSYVIQLSGALRAIHTAGLAARTMDPSKIILVGRSKILLNCCGISDVLTYDQILHNPLMAAQINQQEDLMGLGRVVVALACNSLQAASRENLGASIGFIAQYYSQDLKNLVAYLLTPPQPNRVKSINDIMPMIGARFYAQLEAAQVRVDMLEDELAKEVENGRLFRLLSKLGTVNERPEFSLDPTWSETGDRYLLKLFRDYLFHQVDDEGRPWLDMAHLVQSLNKLDAGVPERISLVSRDGQNSLIVSYADLRRCLDQAFSELLAASSDALPQPPPP